MIEKVWEVRGSGPHTPVNVRVYQVGSRHANEASITE